MDPSLWQLRAEGLVGFGLMIISFQQHDPFPGKIATQNMTGPMMFRSLNREPQLESMKEVLWCFLMSSDGEVPEEFPTEENSHLWRPVAGHCLVKLLLRESLKCSPILPENLDLDQAFPLATKLKENKRPEICYLADNFASQKVTCQMLSDRCCLDQEQRGSGTGFVWKFTAIK